MNIILSFKTLITIYLQYFSMFNRRVKVKRSARITPVSVSVFLGILLVLQLLAKSANAETPGIRWQIEYQDAQKLSLRLINSAGAHEIEGSLALPSSQSPSLSVTILAEERCKSCDDSGSQSKVGNLTWSDAGRFRDVWIRSFNLPLLRKKDGQFYVIKELRLDLGFSKVLSRATFPPSLSSPGEQHLQSWLLNYNQSRSWRSEEALAKKSSVSPSTLALPKQRLLVYTQSKSIYVIHYSDLKNANIPLRNIDPRQMRMYFQGKEVPIFISGEMDGRFNENDYIEFIGERARGENSYHSFYTNESQFILVWSPSGLGLRAPLIPVSDKKGAKTVNSFTSEIHIENDEEVLQLGSVHPEDIQDLGERIDSLQLNDFWFWDRIQADKDQLDLSFSIPQGPSNEASINSGSQSNFIVSVGLKGVSNDLKADPDHHLKFLLNGKDISLVNGVSNDAYWEGQASHVWTSKALPGGILKPGLNVLSVQSVNDLKTSEGNPVTIQDAYVNYIDLRFSASTDAVAGRLNFSNRFSDSLGLHRFQIGNLSKKEISLWNVAGEKLTGYSYGNNFGSLNISFSDSLTGLTEYMLCEADQRETARLQLDTLDDLYSIQNAADYIVVTHKSLRGKALDSLVAHRKAQGMRVRIAYVSDIYQIFGNGQSEPNAIRNFIKHAYQNWQRPASSYVVLIGETSLWFDKKKGASQINLVPTHVVNIPGWGVTSNDDWFVKVSGDDDIADLYIGRIPVATTKALSDIVYKTMHLENDRPAGNWTGKNLLLGGFDKQFTEGIDKLQSKTIASQWQFSRNDLYANSNYYLPESGRKRFYSQIDSAFNLVTFFGHGGGAVWSDAGLLTLKDFSENNLKGNFPIPLVLSITCLTGYFEDINGSGLGEEMLRRPINGAATFYGASGYISNSAGVRLSQDLLDAAYQGGNLSAGQIILQAETAVKLKTGKKFAPILAEFDLLGDPALRLRSPISQGILSLKPQALNGKNELEINGTGFPSSVTNGTLSLSFNDSIVNQSEISPNNGNFLQKITFAKNPVGKSGRVIAQLWNKDSSYSASSSISTLDWIIDSVRVQKPGASKNEAVRLGDTVTLSLSLGTSQTKVNLLNGICAYSVVEEGDHNFTQQGEVLLTSDSTGQMKSASHIVLVGREQSYVKPQLRVIFRITAELQTVEAGAASTSTSLNNISSAFFDLPIISPCDLSFRPNAFELKLSDTLQILSHISNIGFNNETDYALSLYDSQNRLDSVRIQNILKPGQSDSVTLRLPDSSLGHNLSIRLHSISGLEYRIDNNEGEFHYAGRSKLIRSSADSLFSENQLLNLSMRPSGASRRLFLSEVSLPGYRDYLNPANLTNGQSTGFLISSSVNDAASEVSAAFVPSTRVDLPPKPYWHWYHSESENWLRIDTLSSSVSGQIKATLFKSGSYGLLYNSDQLAPRISFTAQGRKLLPDDYVPKGSSIDITIEDDQGVDDLMHPPTLTSVTQLVDSSSAKLEKSASLSRLLRIRFLPKQSRLQDTLEVSAYDISGNLSKARFAYRLGDALHIQNLGNYPNPFADTTVIAFSLTDYCRRVELEIFSRAGRPVFNTNLHDRVGYQEFSWDGRTNSGKEIANGLYYLKVTAQGTEKKSHDIIKLFKIKRR